MERSRTGVGGPRYRSLVQSSPFHTRRLGDFQVRTDVASWDIARPDYRRPSQRGFLESEPALPLVVRSNPSLEPTADRRQKFHTMSSTPTATTKHVLASGRS